MKTHSRVWAGQDSNPRRTQSARFTVWCHWPLGHLPVVPSAVLRRCPAAPLVGALPVTIRTHQVALGEFGGQHPEGNPALVRECRNVEQLRFAFPVIKIQHVGWGVSPTVGTRLLLGSPE